MSLALCVPSHDGESQPVYSASTAQRFAPAAWMNYRADCIGQPGYVPMLFDGNVERMQLCANVMLDRLPFPDMLLAFNEPEREDQADMTPKQAVTALRQWWQLISYWFVPVAVGGVNVSVHHGRAPYEWLDSFVGLLNDAERKQIAYWHVHAYGAWADVDEAISRFERWMQCNGVVRPVILSETGSSEKHASLMLTLRSWLASKRLHMAFWFSAYYADWNETGLLDADGELTAIGEAWFAQDDVTTVYMPQVYA